jgi:dGTPase
MTLFWEGAESAPDESPAFNRSFPGKIYALLSSSYRTLFEDSTRTSTSGSVDNLDYLRLQLVADDVAGMTDTFAIRLHQQLKNG